MATATLTPALFPGQEVFTTTSSSPNGPSAYGVGFNRVKITLTSAQILAINTTPITLVSAPGVGWQIVPIAALINMKAGSVAYTDGGGGAVSFTQGTWGQALSANTVFLAAATDTNHQLVNFNLLATAAAPATNENAALTLTKATGNFAAGNGIASIVVYYEVQQTI